MRSFALFVFFLTSAAAGDRFAYLDEDDPYYPHGEFPKLTTPMWIGEPGVDAVICLTIDDMCRAFPEGARPKGVPTYARRPRVYFDFLKPVANRLREIDGRAPISIFALQLEPDHPLVHEMLDLGMSIEAHTYTHPVPLMRAPEDAESPESLELPMRDFLDSLENLSRIPDGAPVAFRVPGSDARNTPSPRFYTEILPRLTTEGSFLRMDSSIFMAFSDPKLNKFVDGIPFTKSFRNYVVDYPYPFVLNRTIWELPATIPGDAHGVHAYGRESDETVADWKRAIDRVVEMKGVYTLCFHPHGYIKSEQLVDLVDYANRKYGHRIRFLNCREIDDRLTDNLCNGIPLRDPNGTGNHLRLADVNADGFLDVLIGQGEARIWNVLNGKFDTTPMPPVGLTENVRLFTAAPWGAAGLAYAGDGFIKAWWFDGDAWQDWDFAFPDALEIDESTTFRFRDLNGDGVSDLILDRQIFLSDVEVRRFDEAAFTLPKPDMLANGLRFVDLDADGDDDLVFSNETGCGVWRYENAETGWREIWTGEPDEIPQITEHGRNGGVWFHSNEMIQMNEFTVGEPDHIRRVSFQQLLNPD